jgi:hypothetical protein
VPAIDLADENARPIAEAQLGKSRLDHQVVDRQSKRQIGIVGSAEAQPGRPSGLHRLFIILCRLHQQSFALMPWDWDFVFCGSCSRP